jgi:hypothetical protein
MSSRSKRAGTTWERIVVDYLMLRGHLTAERRALAGGKDRGDVAGLDGLVIEAKNEKTMDLPAGVDEATIEAANAGASYFVAVFKRRYKNVADAYAVTRLGNYLAMYEELKTSPRIRARGEETRNRMVAAIKDHIATHGYPPTVRELGDAVGLKSTSSVFAQLRTLAMQKRITYKPEMPRTIQLTDAAQRCPSCGRPL